jgi:lipoprotein-anchoring transpeptidase ErfK/SrfK
MRAGSTGFGRRWRWAALAGLVTLAVCTGPTGVAWADSSPSPSPTATTVAWTVAPASVIYGASVTAQGTVTPAAAGLMVTVAVGGVTVAGPVTDANGAFSATFVPIVGGTVTATLADGTAGTPQTLAVAPKLTLKHGATMPWGRTRLSIAIAPATYAGRVTATVFHHGKKVAVVAGHAAAGALVLRVPTRGVGKFTVRVAAAASGSLAAAPVVKTTLKAGWRRLAVGSKGPYVRIMLERLAALRFRVPGISPVVSVDAGDSIVAFQKAYGLSRTYVFDGADWRKLDTARLIKVRFKSPTTHIEIDKTRQILMIVKAAKPYGILPVSTGATGNTPVGRFHILWKAPSTSTWLGPAILWRTMDFYRNFAMHGYPEVPPYPASHGCVREPIWVANWTYVHSWVGETVYIHY